jgi:hypothetical protein
MEVTRNSCTLHCQVQYRSPGLGRARKVIAIDERLSVTSGIEAAMEKFEEISLAPMNV